MFSTTTRLTFGEVKQRRKVKTFCIECNRKLTRVLVESYFRNGMHDERKTRQDNEEILGRLAKTLEKQGAVCKSCVEKLSIAIRPQKWVREGMGKYSMNGLDFAESLGRAAELELNNPHGFVKASKTGDTIRHNGGTYRRTK